MGSARQRLRPDPFAAVDAPSAPAFPVGGEPGDGLVAFVCDVVYAGAQPELAPGHGATLGCRPDRASRTNLARACISLAAASRISRVVANASPPNVRIFVMSNGATPPCPESAAIDRPWCRSQHFLEHHRSPPAAASSGSCFGQPAQWLFTGVFAFLWVWDGRGAGGLARRGASGGCPFGEQRELLQAVGGEACVGFAEFDADGAAAVFAGDEERGS